MKELELIYRKRKHQLLPLALGFAAVFVFFRIIIPQWADITDARDSLSKKSRIIEAKESDITLLNSIPQETLDDDYTTATTALPLLKDIVLIFEELNSTSIRSNVELGGFSVKVGGIYEATPTQKKNERAVSGVPFLNIIVSVSGENSDIRRFAEEMYKSIPLVEIKSVDIGRTDARYDVNFFYKPIVLRPSTDDTVALKALSEDEKRQIETLRSWQPSPEVGE